MKRWLLVLMLILAAGGQATVGLDDKPQPDIDIYGGPPLCC